MTPKELAISEAMKACGSSPAQCADAAIVLAERVTVGENGAYYLGAIPIENVSQFRAGILELKPHLLPPKADASLADRAFIDGSIQARGQLVREIGEAEADKLAKTYGLDSLQDYRRARAVQTDDVERQSTSNNPWDPRGADPRTGRYSARAVTEQAELVKTLTHAHGETEGLRRANEIAAKFGAKVGDTKTARRAA
jgi:hypothetical protein